MTKRALIPAKPRHADDWVMGEGDPKPDLPSTPVVPQVKLKRLTLDLHPSLHRRLKVECAMKGTTMLEEITRLLEEHLPVV